MMKVLLTGVLGVALVWSAINAGTQDTETQWRQWGGPHRDFTVTPRSLGVGWATDSPAQLWSRPLGEGYSSILVDGDILVTMFRNGDDEVVIALDAATGATRWEYAYDAPLLHDGYFDVWLNAAGPGPYSTPVIAGEGIFAIGVNGHLHALDKSTGELRWSHNLVDLFDLVDYNAFASSPLAFEETVIVPLGGSGRGVVAFDQDRGSVVWQSADFDLGPGSPTLISLDGEPQLVVLGQQEVVGLDPTNGRRLWSHPHENELGLNISVPVWGADGLLFVSSGYDGGSRLLRLTRIDGRTSTEEVWVNSRMRVHFGNAILIDDKVVASTGDLGPAFLAALDLNTGEEIWRERTFARAHMLAVDGKLVIVDEDGDLAVASITETGLDVHMRTSALTENAWTPPTLVGGVLYLRDRVNVLALDLSHSP